MNSVDEIEKVAKPSVLTSELLYQMQKQGASESIISFPEIGYAFNRGTLKNDHDANSWKIRFRFDLLALTD